jgi:hypothetical protein
VQTSENESIIIICVPEADMRFNIVQEIILDMINRIFNKTYAGRVLVLVLVYALFFQVFYAYAKVDQDDIIVIGSGRIIKGNVASARNDAISEAIVKGVEEYLVMYFGSEEIVSNFSRLISEVIPSAKDIVENFYILAEEQTSSNFTVLARIKVNEQMMEEILKELGLLSINRPSKKVLFMVSQKIDSQFGGTEISYWWKDPDSNIGLTETDLALHRLFEDYGFISVNRLRSLPEYEYSQGMKNFNLFDEDALRWGMLFSCDMVVLGKCEVSGQEFVNVVLKVMDVETGEILSAVNHSENIPKGEHPPNQPILLMRSLVNRSAMELLPELAKTIEFKETVGSNIIIQLNGLASFRQYRVFRDFLLNEINGVKSITQTRVMGNSISVQVNYVGERDKFQDIILRHSRFPFRADVSRTDLGGIVFDIKSFFDN